MQQNREWRTIQWCIAVSIVVGLACFVIACIYQELNYENIKKEKDVEISFLATNCGGVEDIEITKLHQRLHWFAKTNEPESKMDHVGLIVRYKIESGDFYGIEKGTTISYIVPEGWKVGQVKKLEYEARDRSSNEMEWFHYAPKEQTIEDKSSDSKSKVVINHMVLFPTVKEGREENYPAMKSCILDIYLFRSDDE